uniref:Signal transduction protein n=2 Tax=Anaerobacillus isosaccharinicus TaxID=1532552 RepID=A0A1S2M649_9BACI|nr:cyclic nucleotide-binding/CBS domain-containing protein [Anaerobacillus isosaccharinicus]QOY37215.1 cyclic nucleotide-binding/CBS domain-containing protein [Anaerobacillus isosaccharinicus]
MTLQPNNQFFEKINRHPLFQGVSSQVFADLMEKCTLRSYKKGETVLYKKTPREGLLIILHGMAEVLIDDSSSGEVLEVLQTNDIIGFSSLAEFLGEPSIHVYHYTVEVKAIDETVCLQVPYAVIEERWPDENVRDFVLRQMAVRLRDIYGSLAEQVQLASKWGESDPFIQRVHDMMRSPVNSIGRDETIQNVAKKMLEKKTTSVLVMDGDHLVGIITENDIVARVVASNLQLDHLAYEIMTPNPYTISWDAYYYEALSIFLMNGIKHLPVLGKKGEVVGMVTLSDLMRKKDRGKLNVVQTIEESTSETIGQVKEAIYEVLETLIHDELPTINLLEIITKLYDRLVKHCVELALQVVGKAPVSFAFYQMGSGGRGEQFLLTDQDHFLVYEDGDDVTDYFRMLGTEIVNQLTLAGYEHCKGKMMASEEGWCGSITNWGDRLRRWSVRSTADHVLLGQNFFSLRLVYGDPVLHTQFLAVIQEQSAKARIYMYQMAKVEKDFPVPTLDHPIRALFRLEKTTIDIKKDALFPLHHCLQLLAIKNGLFEGTPLQKITSLMKLNVFSEDFAGELKFAYSAALKIRVNQGWSRFKKGQESTSVVTFTHLKAVEKAELIQALKIIRSLQNQVLNLFAM